MSRYFNIPGILVGGGLLAVAGCSQSSITKVDFGTGYNSLGLHRIVPVEQPQSIQLSSNRTAPGLSAEEEAMIRTFAGAYKRQGRGPLIIAMPTQASNPDSIVATSQAISDIAWQAGIAYDRIAGTTYGRQADGSTPIVLTFKSYEAITTPCPDVSRINLADTSSNEVRANFGCSVRQNLAQMIVNPADLLGDLAMEPADSARSVLMLERFQSGQATGSAAPGQEDSAVSGLAN